MSVWVFYYEKKAPAWVFLREIKRIAHDDLSVCSLKTKSFYHGLKMMQSYKNDLI